jgi:hypothetical protein
MISDLLVHTLVTRALGSRRVQAGHVWEFCLAGVANNDGRKKP